MRFALCAFGKMTGKIITMRAKCEVVQMDHYRLLQREKILSNAVLQIGRTSGTFAAQQTLSARWSPEAWQQRAKMRTPAERPTEPRGSLHSSSKIFPYAWPFSSSLRCEDNQIGSSQRFSRIKAATNA